MLAVDAGSSKDLALRVVSHVDAPFRKILNDWQIIFYVFDFEAKFLRQGLRHYQIADTRADMLRIAHAVAAYAPNAIAIPLGEAGQQVFKLDRLAPANG
ncbi:MAG: exonuclease I, partial [Paracoccaceae bacterium]